MADSGRQGLKGRVREGLLGFGWLDEAKGLRQAAHEGVRQVRQGRFDPDAILRNAKEAQLQEQQRQRAAVEDLRRRQQLARQQNLANRPKPTPSQPAPPGSRYILEYPLEDAVRPISNEKLRADMNAMMEGTLVLDRGPRISFVNDDPRGPSTWRPVTDATAKMVEDGVIASGARSVNVNSTTGGNHSRQPPSLHYSGRAVDINNVDGRPTIALTREQARAFQLAFAAQPNIRDNFGPAGLEKTDRPGAKSRPVHNAKLASQHRSHFHFGGQR